MVPELGLDASPVTKKIKKATESTDVPAPKCHCITLVPVTSSVPSLPFPSSSSADVSTQPSSMASYPIVVIPELVILVESYPDCINQPGGKNYLCHMCSFLHCNLDCILIHVRKHLYITIRCPVCGKGFQNAASLCKHGMKAHQIKIITSSEEQ